MFPKRPSALSVTIFLSLNIILFSYVSGAQALEQEIVNETPSEELLPELNWTDTETDSLQFTAIDLPMVIYREVPAPVVSDENESVESSEDAAVDEEAAKTDEEPQGAEEPRKSFLEVLFDPASRRAEYPEPPESKTDEDESEAELPSYSEPPVEQEVTEESIPPVKVESSEVAPVESLSVETYDEIRAEAVAREVFIYECTGEGWILEDFTDSEGELSDRLRYAGREYLSDKTYFSFYPYETGTYIINLRKTDFSTGDTEKLRLHLEVKDAFDTTGISSGQAAVTETGQEAEKTHVAGAVPAEKESAENFSSLPEELKTLNAGEAAAAAEKLKNTGDCRGAAELLEASIDEVGWNERDILYYSLAGLYESCPGIRDERLAVKNYQKIVDYYPVSNYWLESKERIIYLERNFIYIR